MDKMRWRYGDTNPVVAAVDADTVIEIGDLLWQDIDDAKPAASLRGSRDLGYAQGLFADKFLGVAMQRSRKGDTAPIRVATTGVFEFDCEPAKFELGDLIGPDGNQQVKRVSDKLKAIARVAKQVPRPLTDVLVDIRSTVMTGGIVQRV